MSENDEIFFISDEQKHQDIGLLKTGVRVIKIEKFQRFCLKCGKILPTKIKQNYAHNCEKPDFLL